jgi:hypothetical protein
MEEETAAPQAYGYFSFKRPLIFLAFAVRRLYPCNVDRDIRVSSSSELRRGRDKWSLTSLES